MAKQPRTPRRIGSALVIVYMINPPGLPDGAQLLLHTRSVARRIAGLPIRNAVKPR